MKKNQRIELAKKLEKVARAEEADWPTLARGGVRFDATDKRGPFITSGHDSDLSSEDLRDIARVLRRGRFS